MYHTPYSPLLLFLFTRPIYCSFLSSLFFFFSFLSVSCICLSHSFLVSFFLSFVVQQLESVIHQREQELETQNKKIHQLRQQLSSVSLASESQQNLLLSQSQDLQKRLQEVEEEILRVNIEKQLLEKKYEQCSWKLEQEEVQNKQLKKRQEEKLQEERRILHEKAEEWKKR